MTQEIEKIGSVGFDRYTEIVTELRKLVETIGQAQFAVGDYALEIEPMRASRPRSGRVPEQPLSLFFIYQDLPGLPMALRVSGRLTVLPTS